MPIAAAIFQLICFASVYAGKTGPRLYTEHDPRMIVSPELIVEISAMRFCNGKGNLPS